MEEAAIAAPDETDVLARDRRVDSRTSSDVGCAGQRYQEVDVFARQSRLEYMELPGAGQLRMAWKSRVGQETEYWIPADMSNTRGMLGETGSFDLDYGATPIMNGLYFFGTQYEYVPTPESGAAAFSKDAESVQAELDRYFALRGLEQRDLRAGLLAFVNKSALSRETATDYALWAVREYRSEDTMAAAIDLLTQGGALLARTALERALARHAVEAEADDDFLYAAAIAAGRADHEIVFQQLLPASVSAVREAAVELLANYPSERSREELARLAEGDPSDFIRAMAKEALSDLE